MERSWKCSQDVIVFLSIPDHKTPHAALYPNALSVYSQDRVSCISPGYNSSPSISLQSSTECQGHETCTQHVSPARSSDRSCSTLRRRARRARLLAGEVVEVDREVTTAKLSVVAYTRKRAIRLWQLRRQSREVVGTPAPANQSV